MMAIPPSGTGPEPFAAVDAIFADARDTCAVVFVDVVESVRLVESDESGAIKRWLGLRDAVDLEVRTKKNGRIVKLLGDGMLIEFASVRDAVGVAFRILEIARQSAAAGEAGAMGLKLRVGIDYGHVLREAGDIYGHRVNVASRLLSLADADDIVISAQAQDQLVAGLDAEAEDLGFCYLKNLTEPVRAFRIRPPGGRGTITSGARAVDLRPVVAVIPFANRSAETDARLGDLIADELIHSLSRTPELAVISRLSTAVFRNRDADFNDLRSHLKADYAISGGFRADARALAVDVVLTEVASGRVVWSDRLTGPISDLFSREQRFVTGIIEQLARVVFSSELRKARSEPFPNLQTYTLMLGAVALMHRLAPADFNEARTLLEAAIARASHQPVAQAWLAKWHVLRVQQGWSQEPMADARAALDLTRRALKSDPDSSLALAVDGFVHTNLLRDFSAARERYETALQVNPNDGFALLLRGTLNAFCDRGQEAVRDTTQALRLSPLDPHRYFYDSLAASAHLTHRRFKRAAELAQRSLRANRTHTSTWRVLAVAQWQLGQHEEARRSVEQLLRLEPSLTVEGYRQRAPSAGFAICDLITEALAAAGVPLR